MNQENFPWSELDDPQLGALLRAHLSALQQDHEVVGRAQSVEVAAALWLCGAAVGRQRDGVVMDLAGFAVNGQQQGRWRIEARRVSSDDALCLVMRKRDGKFLRGSRWWPWTRDWHRAALLSPVFVREFCIGRYGIRTPEDLVFYNMPPVRRG